MSKTWEVRFCKGHDGPVVVFADAVDYDGFCADCEREYGELCHACEDGTAYPELDRPLCESCAAESAHWEGLGREAYLREKGVLA